MNYFQDTHHFFTPWQGSKSCALQLFCTIISAHLLSCFLISSEKALFHRQSHMELFEIRGTFTKIKIAYAQKYGH